MMYMVLFFLNFKILSYLFLIYFYCIHLYHIWLKVARISRAVACRNRQVIVETFEIKSKLDRVKQQKKKAVESKTSCTEMSWRVNATTNNASNI